MSNGVDLSVRIGRSGWSYCKVVKWMKNLNTGEAAIYKEYVVALANNGCEMLIPKS